MTRDDDNPGVPPSAFAAGWAAAPVPETPLDAMRIEPETVSAAPPSAPSVSVALANETTSFGEGFTERFDVAGEQSTVVSTPVIASALLNEPQQEGLRYLFNYASKSIRKNRAISEQDRDDLLHDIYMEWWICSGFEVAALPKLLDSESSERQSLRESIYRVFGRYRYRQSAHRTAELAEGDAFSDDTPEMTRDFSIDLQKWVDSLPSIEAKIIDLYYFQHKTMDEIGAEIGMAKQRVSEIHKRALAKHPDAPPN